jgi:hypothetical protein
MTEQEPTFPPEYYADIERMQEAAVAWCKAHPFAEPLLFLHSFEEEYARRAGVPKGEKVAIIAALPDVIDQWAGNADTRHFLRALDEASGHRATYMQVKALVDHQVERQVDRNSGQLAEGDWRCTGCKNVNDGFSSVNKGEGDAPPPGSLSVCFYCAAVQRINDQGNGYAAVSTSEINKLPKPVRMQLLKLKSAVGGVPGPGLRQGQAPGRTAQLHAARGPRPSARDRAHERRGGRGDPRRQRRGVPL